MPLKPLTAKQTVLNRLRGNYQNLLSSLIPAGRIDNRKEYHHLCPFHADHHLGNASTNIETGRGKCFSCDTGWDIFHLVGKISGLSSFQEQLQKVAELTGGIQCNDSPYRFAKPKNSFSKPIHPSLVDSYASNMTNKQYNYLEQYRTISRMTAKKHKIGFKNQRFTIPIFDQTDRIINIRKWLPPESRKTNASKITQHQDKQIYISLNDSAKHAWANHYYDQLSKDQPGLLGCVTNRAEAQVLRLAMIYCLLDEQYIIDLSHLKAALAFWDYCRQSANYIFHGQAADRVTQKVFEILTTGKKTGRELFAAFSNNISKTRLETSLKELIGSGTVVMETQKTGNRGRPTTIYELHSPLTNKTN